MADQIPESRPGDPNPSGSRQRQQRLLGLAVLGAMALVGVVFFFLGRYATRQTDALVAVSLPDSAQHVADTTASVSAAVAASEEAVTLAEMRNVHFRIDDAIALRIRYLRGIITRTQEGAPIDFGDKNSFRIDIHSAEVGLTAHDLSVLMNRYVFAYPDAPLKNLEITTVGSQIKQKGTLRKVVGLPFEIVAEVTATADGRIRLHPTAVKILSIPGKGVMETLGIQLEELLDLSGAQGVTVEENDLLLDPDHLLPPPAIRGRVSAVWVEGDEVIQQFGSPGDSLSQAIERLEQPDPTASNYMFFRRGTLRFGKLFMVQADLQIIDEAPDDPFDFFIDRYVEQLVAGHSETEPDFGLKAYMPDFEDLQRAAGATSPARTDSSRQSS